MLSKFNAFKTNEYMLNYADQYQEAYDAVHEDGMEDDELVINMIHFLKKNTSADNLSGLKKFAVPYLIYDIETWLNSKGLI